MVINLLKSIFSHLCKKVVIPFTALAILATVLISFNHIPKINIRLCATVLDTHDIFLFILGHEREKFKATFSGKNDHFGRSRESYDSLWTIYVQQKKVANQKREEQLKKHANMIVWLYSEKKILNRQLLAEYYSKLTAGVVLGGGILLVSSIFIYSVMKKKVLASIDFRNLQLRMGAFYNQLKPHFVFNAIIPIQQKIMEQRKEEAMSYLNEYESLMKSMFRNSYNLTLYDEETFLNHYLKVEQKRFSYSFQYEIDIQADIHKTKLWVPAYMIQPIVENSLKYGILGVRGGKVLINITSNGKELHIEITDNGRGRPEDIQLRQNHALYILSQRLELYRKKYGIGALTFSKAKEGGLSVSIFIPVFTSDPDVRL